MELYAITDGGQNMKLFLDDTRVPADVGFINEEWTIVRDYETFCVIIDAFSPEEISFDHDLHDFDKSGKERTGKTCAEYLVLSDSKWNVIPKDFIFHVHSMNPVGKKNIEEYIKGYIKHKFGT